MCDLICDVVSCCVLSRDMDKIVIKNQKMWKWKNFFL